MPIYDFAVTSVPVKAAIALLKDRNGRIDIDLPVRGDLSDPEFHYGRLLLKVFVNLIIKAVTSPFSAIARLVGGGEEWSVKIPAHELLKKAVAEDKAYGGAVVVFPRDGEFLVRSEGLQPIEESSKLLQHTGLITPSPNRKDGEAQ